MTVTAWNLDPPPGFQGLRDDKPVTVYHRHLPHWRQEGATYFVTFRLVDSLPQSKMRELEDMKRQWQAQHRVLRRTDCQSVLPRRLPYESASREQLEAFTRAVMQRIENWLDQGMGSCCLKRPDIAQSVARAMQHFDGNHYELDCYIVMPNHVHSIIRPLQSQREPLERILQSRKRHTAREINAALGRKGTLWQEESFDRIVREEEHLFRCIRYIGSNAQSRFAGQCLSKMDSARVERARMGV